MDIKAILAHLEKERDTLEAAINALQAINSTGVRRGRPAGKRRGRHRMSAAARKRISLAQKARWAKQKRAAKKQR